MWAFFFCRSSLLAGINKPIYSGDVKVLPTEDFLALRVLVRFSLPSHVENCKRFHSVVTIMERFAAAVWDKCRQICKPYFKPNTEAFFEFEI